MPFKHEMEMTVWRAVCGTPNHNAGACHANRVLFRNIRCDLELDTDTPLAAFVGKLYRVTIEEVDWPASNLDPVKAQQEPSPAKACETFGERYAEFNGSVPLPRADLLATPAKTCDTCAKGKTDCVDYACHEDATRPHWTPVWKQTDIDRWTAAVPNGDASLVVWGPTAREGEFVHEVWRSKSPGDDPDCCGQVATLAEAKAQAWKDYQNT